MIIAKFENGQSVSQTRTADYWVVEQVAASKFLVTNPAGEIAMSNFHKAEHACKAALNLSKKPYGCLYGNELNALKPTIGLDGIKELEELEESQCMVGGHPPDCKGHI